MSATLTDAPIAADAPCHLGARRRARVVADGRHIRPRPGHADGARAAQGLAPGAGHRDAQHAVGQAMALRQRTDVQRNQTTRGDAVHGLLQADATRARHGAQLHGDAIACIVQRRRQLIAERAALRRVDDVVTLTIDQTRNLRALAAVDHGVARGQTRVGGKGKAVLARHLRLAAAG
ncbi:hypothetical protein G6F65_020658 [Rhizopus arrhizus]|nr:hypothetical protein G6F65_020658 [Rhizopus arrhizus]